VAVFGIFSARICAVYVCIDIVAGFAWLRADLDACRPVITW